MKCNYCKGTGYSNEKPLKCPCKSFCYKCENNEGFIIKLNPICDYCSGQGNIEKFYQIICLDSTKN